MKPVQQRKTDKGSSKSDNSASASPESLKPGSSREAAAHSVGGKGDFGVPVDERHRVDREYTSHNTKMNDPGATQPADYERVDVRDHGAGVPDSGPGSGSGGDLDTDILGFGAGGAGVAQGGPSTDEIGAADADGGRRGIAAPSPRRAAPENAPRENLKEGDFIVRSDGSTGSDGSDSVTNIARGDDSFAGEISSGEGRGEDSDEAVSDASAGE